MSKLLNISMVLPVLGGIRPTLAAGALLLALIGGAGPANAAHDESLSMESDQRPAAIMAVLEDLSALSGDQLGKAVADLMVSFTAVTNDADFLLAIDQWRTVLQRENFSSIDAEALLQVAEGSAWISAGSNALPVHFYLDPMCDPCRGTFDTLNGLAASGEIDLRVTVLPLLGADAVPLALDLLSEPGGAYGRLVSFMGAGTLPDRQGIPEEPLEAAMNEVITRDLVAFAGTGLRSLPVTGFRLADGTAQVVLGSMGEAEARAMILGRQVQ